LTLQAPRVPKIRNAANKILKRQSLLQTCRTNVKTQFMAYSFFFAEQKHTLNNLYGQHYVVSCLLDISIARTAAKHMKNGPSILKICLQDVMYSITRFNYGDVREEGESMFFSLEI
jgi:hypothetical protein